MHYHHCLSSIWSSVVSFDGRLGAKHNAFFLNRLELRGDVGGGRWIYLCACGIIQKIDQN